MNKTCCNNPVAKGKNKDTGIYAYWCETCGRIGEGKTPDEAWKAFQESKPKKKTAQNTAVMLRPSKPADLSLYKNQHMRELMKRVSPIVADSSTAMKMVEDNFRYAQNAKHLDCCYGTDAGEESIIHGIEDACLMMCTLGVSGDLVPFDGKTATFDPDVEAIIFFLTEGDSSPFKWVMIEPIHENDIVTRGRKNGNFWIDFESFGCPRGNVIQVAIYGERKDNGIVMGEVEDAETIMKRAEDFSPSYRSYIQDKRRFEELRGEGKTKFLNGREYYEKELPSKGGKGTWKKKIYEDELKNPYVGSSQAKMFCKSTGKSWMNQFKKIRNSAASVNEMKANMESRNITPEQMADDALHAADQQFPDATNAEKIEPEKPTKPETKPDTKQPKTTGTASGIKIELVEDEETPPAEPELDLEIH